MRAEEARAATRNKIQADAMQWYIATESLIFALIQQAIDERKFSVSISDNSAIGAGLFSTTEHVNYFQEKMKTYGYKTNYYCIDDKEMHVSWA